MTSDEVAAVVFRAVERRALAEGDLETAELALEMVKGARLRMKDAMVAELMAAPTWRPRTEVVHGVG